MASISFHGAAGTVTGSCHLIELENHKFLLDAGEFQGPWTVEQLNYRPPGFDPSEINAIILSHGHLDHCGRIPLFASQGFSGRIYCTPPTKDIAQLILMDSAHILKEEFIWRRKVFLRKGIRANEPLYSFEDVFYAAGLFGKSIPYYKKIELADNTFISFHYSEAGHILGSAQIYMDYRDKKGKQKRLLYTGDIGDGGRTVVNDPDMPESSVDVLVMESTYGNRIHKDYDESLAEFEEAVVSTIANHGTVLIPTFALERAQELLFHIGQLKRAGKISGKVPVFLNSPLAINITRLYNKHFRYCNSHLTDGYSKNESPFTFPGLKMTESTEESMAIHSVEGPKIILAGSGMMTGGRIKHHLKHLLWKENTTLIIVGYQAEGTLGRKIIDGADEVKIFGVPISVKARIYTINGFSAHADQRHLVAFAKRVRPKTIFVVHGEPSSSKALAENLSKALPAAKIRIPVKGQKFHI